MRGRVKSSKHPLIYDHITWIFYWRLTLWWSVICLYWDFTFLISDVVIRAVVMWRRDRAWLFSVAVRVHVWHPVDPGSSLGGVTTLCEGPPGRLTPVWGALDGRSTCGCARNTCVREAQGCASRRWGQCDDVIVTTDEYVLWLPCISKLSSF